MNDRADEVMAVDDGSEAGREQAAIDAEEAASRRREAQASLGAIRDVRASVERRDPRAAASAAVRLHRLHALHEQLAGRIESARAALARARAAQARLGERR